MVDLKFAMSLKNLQLTDGSLIYCQTNTMVHTARNMIVKKFLESDCDKLLFIDVDEIVEPHLALQLDAQDKDIIGAMVCSRVPEYKPCIAKKNGDNLTTIFPYEKGRVEIDTIGMGATMIKRGVFKKMEKPYFYFSSKRDGINTEDDNIGEDINFCLDAKEKGFKIYCDTSLNPKHIGNKEETDYRKSVLYNIQLLKNEGVKKIMEGYYNEK